MAVPLAITENLQQGVEPGTSGLKLCALPTKPITSHGHYYTYVVPSI